MTFYVSKNAVGIALVSCEVLFVNRPKWSENKCYGTEKLFEDFVF